MTPSNSNKLLFRKSEAEFYATPKCGDLYETPEGRYFLVDYVEAYEVGITLCSGVRLSFNKGELAEYIKLTKGKLISKWEDDKWQHADAIGWIKHGSGPVAKDTSITFITEQVGSIKSTKLIDKLN